MTGRMRYHSAEVDDIARYIADDQWVMEQKLDGVRCAVTVTETGVQFSTKSGAKHHPAIAAELAPMIGLQVDGELMQTGELWLFDITAVSGHDLIDVPYTERRELLDQLDGLFDHVHVLPSANGKIAKTVLWASVQASNGEGVIVKKVDGRYRNASGRTRDVLKIKVTRTVDCVVTGFGSGTDSCILSLVRDGQLVEVGKVSLIGKPTVEIGDRVEVRFLYVIDGDTPRLYQARLIRMRPDKTADQCDWAQLDGARTSKIVVA